MSPKRKRKRPISPTQGAACVPVAVGSKMVKGRGQAD
ncbi:hypothetical protein HaLaN_21810, partial [Haematococcus lacustris]